MTKEEQVIKEMRAVNARIVAYQQAVSRLVGANRQPNFRFVMTNNSFGLTVFFAKRWFKPWLRLGRSKTGVVRSIGFGFMWLGIGVRLPWFVVRLLTEKNPCPASAQEVTAT